MINPLGNEIAWAVHRAGRVIHDDNVPELKELIADYPAILSWQGEAIDVNGERHGDGVLAFATGAYGDVFDPQREKDFTRAACAEVLIDAGAVVMPSVLEGLLDARARGLMHLFERKGLLPRALKFLAARGDAEATRQALTAPGVDLATVNEACLTAASFEHRALAALLLEHAARLDPDTRRVVDTNGGAAACVDSIVENRSHYFSRRDAPAQLYYRQKVHRFLHDADLESFVRSLKASPWLLAEGAVDVQVRLVEQAALQGRGDFIAALVALRPALLERQPPPPTKAFEHAMTYAHTEVVPVLTRIWPMPDDLPHHAGMGHLARVGELLGSGTTAQRQLDVALAYAVINKHFPVADLLLAHGADINTTWNSHEPASILHHLVFEDNYESMQYLIDRGIDLAIRDYRWDTTAEGWARYGKGDERMADWLRAHLYTK